MHAQLSLVVTRAFSSRPALLAAFSALYECQQKWCQTESALKSQSSRTDRICDMELSSGMSSFSKHCFHVTSDFIFTSLASSALQATGPKRLVS
jgi:hypothetical protein